MCGFTGFPQIPQTKKVMKHMMMLSDLYGRIGQMLKEHGDAPIGIIKAPLFSNEPHLPIDWVKPLYCTFNHVTTEIEGVKINTYELTVNKE